jgi:hypothetical protein
MVAWMRGDFIAALVLLFLALLLLLAEDDSGVTLCCGVCFADGVVVASDAVATPCFHRACAWFAVWSTVFRQNPRSVAEAGGRLADEDSDAANLGASLFAAPSVTVGSNRKEGTGSSFLPSGTGAVCATEAAAGSSPSRSDGEGGRPRSTCGGAPVEGGELTVVFSSIA